MNSQPIKTQVQIKFITKTKALNFMGANNITQQTLVNANDKWYVVYETERSMFEGEVVEPDEQVDSSTEVQTTEETEE